ncbi:unnamed protein product [Clonostachys rosea f. rosea IK726]|uniref:Initiation-specific alpha-1,6-mannosyltransferase n=2 Tax=Bionectria ochroleuca TaxID=29856 RepID=A0A0B7KAL6_BIOOC|nr:unnamed protein product [Clonostachys rosea f. rosea IK726]
MFLSASRWRRLSRRFLSSRRLVPIALIFGFALLLTFYTLHIQSLHDPRFYERVALHVPHDAASLSSGLAQSSRQGDHLIPHNIWQIFLTPPEIKETRPEIPQKQRDFIESWKVNNRNHEYHLLRDNDTVAFVQENFPQHEALQRIFAGKGSAAMKSDILRYLLLFAIGGVYTDLDTVAWIPIDYWAPREYRSTARLIIGIEFDRLEGENWKGVHHELQFCQWTIAAAPGHPVFSAMVARALKLLGDLEESYGKPFAELKPTTNDVLTTTGPSAWTDAVFQELQKIDPNLKSLRDLSGLKKEKLIGDVLILPIDGFGAGQRHSGSTRLGVPPAARAKHKFHGVWKGRESRI